MFSIKSPSEVPSIPEETEESELSYVEIEPKDIPLPPSTYTPSIPTTSLLSDVDPTPPPLGTRVPSPSTMETCPVEETYDVGLTSRAKMSSSTRERISSGDESVFTLKCMLYHTFCLFF